MKDNLSGKLTLIGGGLLIAAMLAWMAFSICRIFSASSSSPAEAPAGSASTVAEPRTPAQPPPISAAAGAAPATDTGTPPGPASDPFEMQRQREKIRLETIAELKREMLEQAGTAGVPQKVLQELEQSNPIIQ